MQTLPGRALHEHETPALRSMFLPRDKKTCSSAGLGKRSYQVGRQKGNAGRVHPSGRSEPLARGDATTRADPGALGRAPLSFGKEEYRAAQVHASWCSVPFGKGASSATGCSYWVRLNACSYQLARRYAARLHLCESIIGQRDAQCCTGALGRVACYLARCVALRVCTWAGVLTQRCAAALDRFRPWHGDLWCHLGGCSYHVEGRYAVRRVLGGCTRASVLTIWQADKQRCTGELERVFFAFGRQPSF